MRERVYIGLAGAHLKLPASPRTAYEHRLLEAYECPPGAAAAAGGGGLVLVFPAPLAALLPLAGLHCFARAQVGGVVHDRALVEGDDLAEQVGPGDVPIAILAVPCVLNGLAAEGRGVEVITQASLFPQEPEVQQEHVVGRWQTLSHRDDILRALFGIVRLVRPAALTSGVDGALHGRTSRTAVPTTVDVGRAVRVRGAR